MGAEKPTSDITHTSIVLFIGPDGRKRYVGVPYDQRNAEDKAYLPSWQLSSWGYGIALVAPSLSK